MDYLELRVIPKFMNSGSGNTREKEMGVDVRDLGDLLLERQIVFMCQ
jgi:hypothetical protein